MKIEKCHAWKTEDGGFFESLEKAKKHVATEHCKTISNPLKNYFFECFDIKNDCILNEAAFSDTMVAFNEPMCELMEIPLTEWHIGDFGEFIEILGQVYLTAPDRLKKFFGKFIKEMDKIRKKCELK